MSQARGESRPLPETAIRNRSQYADTLHRKDPDAEGARPACPEADRPGAEFYGVTKSDAVAQACEDVVGIIEAAEEVLNREDLTMQQRREIAESFSTRSTAFDVQLQVECD